MYFVKLKAEKLTNENIKELVSAPESHAGGSAAARPGPP